MQFDLAIIGGGPAGLMAAFRAAQLGKRVVLLEKNRRPGVKILMAGGTRCNLTHATDARGIVAAFGRPGRFLHSALSELGPADVVEFFRQRGVPTYVEEGGKIFPRSNRSADVLDALMSAATGAGCQIAGLQPVEKIEPADGDCPGFRIVTPDRVWTALNVLLATGGQSYPSCGTRGDGYKLAAALGHTILAPRTALAPLISPAPWVLALTGVTLANVELKVLAATDPPASTKNVLAQSRAAMLFTHFGLSGPAPMNVSRALSGPGDAEHRQLVCDFLPGVAKADLEAWLDDECHSSGKRQTSSVIAQQLPHRLADALVGLVLGEDGRAGELARSARRRLVDALKHLPIAVSGTLGFKKAEATAGGVALDEVDSRTMQSKLTPGLYFAGELLDLDGPIGGFNFQAAFSTGYLAASRMSM